MLWIERPNTLDYTGIPNKQYRVDILKRSADPFSVAPADVLATVFRTDLGDPRNLAPTRMTFDLSPYAGQTVRLRFARVSNVTGCFLASVDDIDVQTRRFPAPCTITRGSGNNVIRGTSGDDVICAGGGNDVVYGGSGNDTILGQQGNNALRGGSGNDRLVGGSGRDDLAGQRGSDTLDARDGVQGNDVASGGRGADSCCADPRDVQSSC